MPVYEYECKDCGIVLAVRKPVNDDTNVGCNHCYKKMDKLVSVPASIRVGKYGKGGGS